MVDEKVIGEVFFQGVRALIVGSAEARLLLRRPPAPEPAGPFIVRNLAHPHRFYQRQELSFLGGGFIPRASQGHDLLGSVCSSLQGTQCVGLWGEGGVGKTRLAAEAVAKLLQDFPGGAFWLSAYGRERFGLHEVLQDLGGLVGGLGPLERRNIERAVRRRLQGMGRILLILDNLDKVNDPDLWRFIAELPGNCSLLFTTKLWLDQEYENYHQVTKECVSNWTEGWRSRLSEIGVHCPLTSPPTGAPFSMSIFWLKSDDPRTL